MQSEPLCAFPISAKHKMKTILTLTALALCSCVTTTYPDGTIEKRPDPGAVQAGLQALVVIASDK